MAWKLKLWTMWCGVNFQVLSWYVIGVSNRHTRVMATAPTKSEKQTPRHSKLMSTEPWAWSPEQKWQLASGSHRSGTAVADPPSDPATNDIQTGAHDNSQQLTQTGYIIHRLHHCHKHQGLDPLIRSVSTVTAALSNASSVFQLFSFLVVCCGMISKGFGFVAFFASVKASSVCIHLSCLVCL